MNSYRIIIPARLHSSRLAKKLLKKIGNKTILEHSYRSALKSQAKEVIIAADDQEIISLAESFDAKVILTNKYHPSGTDRLSECVNKLSLDDKDIIVNLQGDEPFMPPELIDLCAKTLIQSSNADIATLATPINNEKDISNPNIVKVVCDSQSNALFFSRAAIPFNRDNQPLNWHKDYFHHMGIYAYKTSFLKAYQALEPCPLENIECLEQLRALYYGYTIAIATTTQKPPKGIDTKADLLEAINYYQFSKGSTE